MAEFCVEDDRLARHIFFFISVLMKANSQRHCFGFFVSIFWRNKPFFDENVACLHIFTVKSSSLTILNRAQPLLILSKHHPRVLLILLLDHKAIPRETSSILLLPILQHKMRDRRSSLSLLRYPQLRSQVLIGRHTARLRLNLLPPVFNIPRLWMQVMNLSQHDVR